MRSINFDQLLQRFDQLNQIGIALSREKNITHLLETILVAAKTLLNAEGGTLYRLEDGCRLRFVILHNDALNIRLGGTRGQPVPFPPLPLYDDVGQPNKRYVVTYAVLEDITVNIADAYLDHRFDFSGTRAFDQQTGYRSQSFLTVPLKNHEDEIIGVLQLLNARDPVSGEITVFSKMEQQLVESLASQAAIALTNRLLIDQLKSLFESLINLINMAIDEKSPYTGGHCQRVPMLTMMLAEAVNDCDYGSLCDFRLSEDELYELKIAGLLHDCGKITTPVHVVDKATKLETLFDRIHLLDTRFEVLKRDAEIAWLRARLAALEGDTPPPAADPELHRRWQQLDDDRRFLHHCNQGGEFMPMAAQERLRQIAEYRWVNPEGQEVPFLSGDELNNLAIVSGTLNAQERAVINNHVALTHRMLHSLPWPKHLRHVPEVAGSHHERLDGKGYHRGLPAERLSIQARILCIADVFEALTAADRPYKSGKTLSESLTILGNMVLDGAIDPDLFDIFIRQQIWLIYAEHHLASEQMDAVDVAQLPGYTP
jgi:HD-GYP domain-containing protein (c-di-GMP phosphodiesterase class II)